MLQGTWERGGQGSPGSKMTWSLSASGQAASPWPLPGAQSRWPQGSMTSPMSRSPARAVCEDRPGATRRRRNQRSPGNGRQSPAPQAANRTCPPALRDQSSCCSAEATGGKPQPQQPQLWPQTRTARPHCHEEGDPWVPWAALGLLGSDSRVRSPSPNFLG